MPVTNLFYRLSSWAATVAVVCLLALWALVGNYSAYFGAIFVLLAVLLSALTVPWKELFTAKWVMSLYAGVALVSLAFALQGGGSSYDAFDAFIVFLLAPLFGAAAYALRRQQVSVVHLGWVFWLASLLAAIQCVWFRLSSDSRLVPVELSPIHFADLAIICGFLALVVTFDTKGRWRFLALTGPMLGTFAVMMAQTRGAVPVGVGVGFIWTAFLVLGFKHISRREKWWSVCAVFGGVLIAILASNEMGAARVLDVFENTGAVLAGDSASDLSIYSRFEQYSAALQAISKSPLFGHGWHNQIAVAYEFMSLQAQALYDQEHWGYIHNEFLSFTVAAGVLGSLSYMCIMAAPLMAVRWSGGDARLMYVAVTFVVGLALSGATDVLFMVEVPKFILVMLAAVLFALGPPQPSAANT